jgi:hypothetical protein
MAAKKSRRRLPRTACFALSRRATAVTTTRATAAAEEASLTLTACAALGKTYWGFCDRSPPAAQGGRDAERRDDKRDLENFPATFPAVAGQPPATEKQRTRRRAAKGSRWCGWPEFEGGREEAKVEERSKSLSAEISIFCGSPLLPWPSLFPSSSSTRAASK